MQRTAVTYKLDVNLRVDGREEVGRAGSVLVAGVDEHAARRPGSQAQAVQADLRQRRLVGGIGVVGRSGVPRCSSEERAQLRAPAAGSPWPL